MRKICHMRETGRVLLAVVCLCVARLAMSGEPPTVFEGDHLYGLSDSDEAARERMALSSYVRGQYLLVRIMEENLRDPDMIAEAIGCLREALKAFPGDSELIGKLTALHDVASDPDGLTEDLRQMAEANWITSASAA